MAENEPTSPNARFTSSPKVASPHLRICGTQGVEERPREGFPSESGVARKASKGTSADDGNSGEIAMAKYVASPIFTFSQPVNVKTNQIAEKSARFVALTSFPFSSPHPVDVTFNQIAEKPESIFGTSRGSSSTLPAPPVSPSPSAHSASQAPPTKFAQIPPQWLPRQPLPPSSLPQHLLPPSLRSTTQPASPPPPSLLHFPPPTTYKNSPNLSSSPQSVASSSVPTSGATNVFGGGSTTPSVHHSSKSPLPSSPNIFGCLMQPPPASLPSRWPPIDKTSQNLSFGHNLFRSGATPATSSVSSGLFGPPVQPSPGTLFGAPANGGQPPSFASPEVAINIPSTWNPGLSPASAPTFSSPGQGHQIISIELRLMSAFLQHK